MSSPNSSSIPGNIANSSAASVSAPCHSNSAVMYPCISDQFSSIMEVWSISCAHRPVAISWDQTLSRVEDVGERVRGVGAHHEHFLSSKRGLEGRCCGHARLADAALAGVEDRTQATGAPPGQART